MILAFQVADNVVFGSAANLQLPALRTEQIFTRIQFTSVADPGSGAFLTPGSGIGKKSGSGSGIRIRDEQS